MELLAMEPKGNPNGHELGEELDTQKCMIFEDVSNGSITC